MLDITNSKDCKRIISNFFSLFLVRGIDLILPLILLPFLLNRLGAEKYGLVAMSMSLSLYLGSIIQYGFSLTATRDIALNTDNKDRLNKKFSLYFTSNLILGSFVSVSFLLSMPFFSQIYAHKVLYTGSFLYVLFYSIFPFWFFQGLEKFKFIAITTISIKLAYLILVFLLIKNSNDYQLVPYLNFISAFSVFIFALIYIFFYKKIKYVVPSINELKQNYIIGFSAFIMEFLPNLYNNLTVFILGISVNPAVAGIFSAASILVEGVNSVIRIASNIIYPYLVKNKEKLRVVTITIITLVIIGVILFNIILPYTAVYFFKNNTNEIVKYSSVLSMSSIFAATYIFLGVNYHLIHNKEKELSKIVFIISCLCGLLSLILIPKYGILAAILVIVLARFFLALGSGFSVLKFKYNSRL